MKRMKSRTVDFRLVLGFFMIITLVWFISRFTVTEAKQLKEINTYYKSIEIEDNDSLYELAHKYNSTEVQSYDSYIKDVMSLNHLTDSKLVSGMHLVVPYYKYAE